MNIALLQPPPAPFIPRSKSTHDRLRNWKEVAFAARLKQQLNTLGNVLSFFFLFFLPFLETIMETVSSLGRELMVLSRNHLDYKRD